MRARFFIIHNPNAGQVARHLFDATLARLRQAGAWAEIVDTTRHGEGRKAVAEAAESRSFDAVVAAGGDGTVHDATEGLVGHSMPLGIIPMGTGNVFARELNLAGPCTAFANSQLLPSACFATIQGSVSKLQIGSGLMVIRRHLSK